MTKEAVAHLRFEFEQHLVTWLRRIKNFAAVIG